MTIDVRKTKTRNLSRLHQTLLSAPNGVPRLRKCMTHSHCDFLSFEPPKDIIIA